MNRAIAGAYRNQHAHTYCTKEGGRKIYLNPSIIYNLITIMWSIQIEETVLFYSNSAMWPKCDLLHTLYSMYVYLYIPQKVATKLEAHKMSLYAVALQCPFTTPDNAMVLRHGVPTSVRKNSSFTIYCTCTKFSQYLYM